MRTERVKPDVHRLPATTGSDHRPRRILVIDRDEPNRSAVAAVLADDGFEIAGAVDPRQARALTMDLKPAAVVLAVAGDDDIQAVAEVAADRIAPVVVLAKDAGPVQVARARDAGAHAYLPAAPHRSALVPAVEMAIGRHAEISRLAAEVAAADRRLETRKVIDRAKGLLMTHRGMTEPEAFRWIQRTAMNRRESSAAIAGQVVAEFGESDLRAAS
jgi:two-component system, response regulator PdtaR